MTPLNSAAPRVSFSLTREDNSIYINAIVVPEPTSAVLLILALFVKRVDCRRRSVYSSS